MCIDEGKRLTISNIFQEVVVNGQDKTYKDVIEPLESVSVSIVQTRKIDIHELGPPEKVVEALVKKGFVFFNSENKAGKCERAHG